MKFTFVPEYIFDTFDKASCEFLQSIGIKGIILDIDNTLEPYEHPLPGEHVKAWLESLSENGICAAIVSNNGRERVELFNKDLSLFAVYKAKKPFKKNVLIAMEKMGTDLNNTILMGDQVFTDVWAAHNAGIPAILVPPINDKRDIFTRFKRLLEKPILKKYEKRKNK
jgi:HAD superfamily phosphatase (TIGR01668 family)